MQRFRCCHCGRTFNDLTGTPLARLRLKGKWRDYLGALLDSQAVRAAAIARTHCIAHRSLNLSARERVRSSPEGAIHVQNVNAYHRRLREWLARFHGVASHRLPNYLGWRWALDGERVTSIEQLLRIAFGVINR